MVTGLFETMLAMLATWIVCTIVFWFFKPKEGIKIAIINNQGYWQLDGTWFAAPIYDDELHTDEAVEVDLDNLSTEEVKLLMQTLE